jgi:branched-chain amino acid transport system substrate-binding protein
VAGAYDCVNILLDGIQRAGTTEPQAVLKAIEETTDLPGLLVPSISFTHEQHNAFRPDDLAVYEMKRHGDKLQLDIISK